LFSVFKFLFVKIILLLLSVSLDQFILTIMLCAAKFSSYEVHWWKVACISVRYLIDLDVSTQMQKGYFVFLSHTQTVFLQKATNITHADASLGNEICSVNTSVEASLSIQQQPHVAVRGRRPYLAGGSCFAWLLW